MNEKYKVRLCIELHGENQLDWEFQSKDEDTKIRFNKGIRKEQDKEIESKGTSTISKSNVCEDLILKWLDKNYPE